MKSIATLQYDAGEIVRLVARANPEALIGLVVQDLAANGYAVRPENISFGPDGSVTVSGAQALPPQQPQQPAWQAPPAAPGISSPWAARAERDATLPPPGGWQPPPQPAWQPPPQPQWQQQAPQAPPQAPQPLYVAEPLAPPAPRIQAPPPPAAPAGPSPLAARVFGAPHAAEVQTGLPEVPGEEVIGRTPSGTLFTRLGTRPSLAGGQEGETDGYPDLSSLQADAPTMTSRPGDGSDPRFNAVDIPNLDFPRDPRVREVGRPSGLAEKVQREGLFSDGAAPPRLTGTGGFAWNPQGPGQGDPGPRPSFLDAFIQNPNKD